jgi:hypothetical protein
MADTTYDASGLPLELRGLLSQFEPSEADKAAARRMAQQQFFLGLLGARRGDEFGQIGRSGLLANAAYQDQIKNLQTQRGQNITQAGALYELLRKQRTMDAATKLFNSDESAPQGPSIPPAGIPAGAVGGGGMGGGTASAFGAGSQPGPVASAQPATQLAMPTWRQIMPKAAQAMALASGDPKTILEQISKYAETKMGPDGTVTTVTGIPLYKMTPAGVQLFTPQGMPGEFAPFPQGATDAEAKRAATVAGATSAATKAAEFPYQIDTAVGPGNVPQRGYASQLYGPPQLPGQQPPGQQPQQRPGTNILMPDDNAAHQMALAADRAGQQVTTTVPGMPQRPGVITGADPLAMKEAEGAIASRTAQNTLVAEGQGKDYLAVIDSEKQAPGNIAKYELMKNYLGKVETGKLAPSVLGLKSVAAYVAPNLAKDWTKEVPYAQAASALSNEIALQLRNPTGGAGMPGSMSNSDRDFLVSMTASSANDPRAIPLMLDARIAMEKRAQDVGQLARQYRQQYGQLDEGFYQKLQDYSNAHPMFKGVDQGSSAPAGWSAKRINRGQ